MPRACSPAASAAASSRPPFSRDAYFVVRRPLIEGDHALTVPSLTTTPKRSSAAARAICSWCPGTASPWSACGTRSTCGAPDAYEITEAELEAWIGEVNLAYPAWAHASTTSRWAAPAWSRSARTTPTPRPQVRAPLAHRRPRPGARPRGPADPDRRPLHHRTGRGRRGGRPDLPRRLPRAAPPSRLAATPVRGGGFDDFEALVARSPGEAPGGDRPRRACAPCVHNHGTAIADSWRCASGGRAGPDRCPGATCWGPRSPTPPGARWR